MSCDGRLAIGVSFHGESTGVAPDRLSTTMPMGERSEFGNYWCPGASGGHVQYHGFTVMPKGHTPIPPAIRRIRHRLLGSDDAQRSRLDESERLVSRGWFQVCILVTKRRQFEGRYPRKRRRHP